MQSTIRSTMLLAMMVGAALAVPSQAAAHSGEIDRGGLYLGFAGMGNFVVNQANAPARGFINHGAGASVFLGARLAPMIALEGGYAMNLHNPVQNWLGETVEALVLHSGTLDLKVLFPNRSPVRPYCQAGLGLYALGSFPDRGLRGGVGFQMGGGLDIWVSPGLSLGARALYHGISFTENIGTDKPFLSTVSVEGNLQFHF